MMNIAEWIVVEKNKNNPYAFDTFTDFTSKGVRLFPTFCKRCDMFAEIYGVVVNEEQRVRLHRWLCGYCTDLTYQRMIERLIELM